MSPPDHDALEPADRELVTRSQAGDQAAFGLLVTRHERRVFNVAYRMLGRHEDARDATQEAFISCFRHLSAFRGDAAFTTWLHRITVNACYDFLRRKTPIPMDVASFPEPVAGPDPADTAADTVDVQRALLRVPPDFRAVLILHDVQGLPYEDIAQALDVPLGTVKSRLHRARIALGRALVGEPDAISEPSKPAIP